MTQTQQLMTSQSNYSHMILSTIISMRKRPPMNPIKPYMVVSHHSMSRIFERIYYIENSRIDNQQDRWLFR